MKAAGLLLAVMVVGCARDAVVRVMDGDAVVGRFIDERAYDAYLRGSIFEQEGRLAEAEEAYQQAYESDAEGIAPLVRMAAVRCALGPQRYGLADEAFEAARKLQEDYGPLHTELARCALARGQLDKAERDLARAMVLDPKDEETTVLRAQLLQRTGRTPEAVRVLQGFVTWRPNAPHVWTELERLASREPGSVQEWVLRMRPVRSSARREVDPAESLARIDAAIVRGDLQEAKARAVRRPRSAAVVPVRAAALGQWTVAVQQAALVLRADPSDPDARAVVMSVPGVQMAIDTLGERSWSSLLGTSPDPDRPSPLAALLLADALQRRLGAEASRKFLERYGEIPADPSDPLLQALRARLAAR